MHAMGSQLIENAFIIVIAGMCLVPLVDFIFHELAPVDQTALSTGAMQLRLTDLILTAICYGLALGVLKLFKPGSDPIFFVGAGYLLVAEILGLLAAMDVCRKTRKRYSNDVLQRSCIFLIFFLVFPLTLPAALLAWGRWARLAG
jgi:hypothetical protein